MKLNVIGVALVVLMLCALPCGTLAAKHSKAHQDAVRKCTEQYQAAVRAAKLLQGPLRKARLAAAKKTLHECKQRAPQ